MREVTIFDQEYTSPLVLCEEISKIARYYQANSANEVAGHIESGYSRIMVKSPTGTGKTLISKLIALSVRLRMALGLSFGDKLRVLYIANKHRLNRQAIEEYAENESVELIVQ
jgi:type I site-specific restriction endonuclease